MFGWEFPPYNSGGLGVACSGLARALAKENVDILFVLPKHINIAEPSVRFLFAGIEQVAFKGVRTGLTPYRTAAEYSRWRSGEGDIYGENLFSEVLRYAALVRKLIEGEDFDIIHAHDWLSFPAGIEAKRISRKPLIVHVHATGFDQGGGEHADSRVYAIEKEGMEEADAVVAVSEYTRRMIIERYHIEEKKVHVVHNGIDVDFHTAEGGSYQNGVGPLPLKIPGYKIVLYVGRLTLQKGPDYFLRAAKRVLDENPKTFFIIAGSGDMERQMIRLAAEIGIAENVFFSGFVRGADLERLYRAADLFVLPSVSEPFGITPLESLLADTPVLISKQSGVSEVITHALKVDFWDTEEMANKIISVLRYPPLKKQLSRSGKEEAQKLTWGKAAEKCVMLYHRILAELRITN